MTDRKKPVIRLLAVSLFLGAALAGCVAQDAQAATGEIYVKDNLTDEAAAVYITFNRAEVLPASSRAWSVVFEGEETFEMLSLSGPNDKAKLAGFQLSPGEYLQLRIAVTNVTVVGHDGNETYLVTFGNVVTIAHGFTVGARGAFEILVDFDLEEGVSLATGEYVPVVGFAQTTHRGSDGNRTERDDRPEQANAMDQRGLVGLCAAWSRNAQGRDAGNVTNATAFLWLSGQAAAANQTTEGYCADAERPGRPGTLAEVLPTHMPEHIREALQDRRMGPPGSTPGAGGPPSGTPGGAGNETGPGNQGGSGHPGGGNPGAGGPPS